MSVKHDLPNTKKIDGKMYYYAGTCSDKQYIKVMKEKLKYARYSTRVIKDKHGYNIYAR
jgi:hypothetical protein